MFVSEMLFVGAVMSSRNPKAALTESVTAPKTKVEVTSAITVFAAVSKS